MIDRCKACNLEQLFSEKDKALNLCKRCADGLGVVEMPPARRKLAPCRCCSGMVFIRASPREIGSEIGSSAQLTLPMAVTIGGTEAPWFGHSVTADARRAFGRLEMYVCRGCGYVEWYCNDPEEIPIGPQFMTEWIEPSEAGIYR